MPCRCRSPHLARFVKILFLSALLSAGCGGKDEVTLPGPDSPTAPLPRAEFVSRANEVCRAAAKSIADATVDAGPSGLGGSSDADASKLVEAVEPIATQAVRRLRNLTPPPEDAAVVTKGLDEMQAVIDRARTDARSGLINPIGTVDKELYDYGLASCFAGSP